MKNFKVEESTPILDIVENIPEAIGLFEKLGESVGECIMCKHLFEPLGKVADIYGMDRKRLIDSIKSLSGKKKA